MSIFFKINDKIKSPKIRITGDGINEIINLSDALTMAREKNLDLVEFVPNTDPPVCKIIDFRKFLYDRKEKEKKIKKDQRKNTIKTKEIRLTYNTGEHDLNFKLKHAINFLSKNDRVRFIVWFKGREIQYVDQGKILLLNLVNELKKYGKIEQLPKLEGKKLSITIMPLK